MALITRLTDQHLLKTLNKFPPEILYDDSQRAFWLSIAIIKHFFGSEWLEEHIAVTNPKPGFLRVIAGQGPDTQKSAFKVVDFAELLINLQGVEGIDRCIQQMRDGNIESTYAEFDFGRMLYVGNAAFRFVAPQGKRWSDYDVEITLSDGVTVCADAKCKIETTDFSPETVNNALNKARKQFPADKPCAIFIKIPSRWLEQVQTAIDLMDIARKFLRGTRRVVSVKLYSQFIGYREGTLTHSHGFKEISNPTNRFEPNRNWDMFAEPRTTGVWNGMPQSWKRLLFYPKDGPG
jgi:hypothetical protein